LLHNNIHKASQKNSSIQVNTKYENEKSYLTVIDKSYKKDKSLQPSEWDKHCDVVTKWALTRHSFHMPVQPSYWLPWPLRNSRYLGYVGVISCFTPSYMLFLENKWWQNNSHLFDTDMKPISTCIYQANWDFLKYKWSFHSYEVYKKIGDILKHNWNLHKCEVRKQKYQENWEIKKNKHTCEVNNQTNWTFRL
jgi:hypothetical protein